MEQKIYHISEQLYGTEQELIEIFDKYDIDEFYTIYFSIPNTEEIRVPLRPYFKKRMKEYLGFI